MPEREWREEESGGVRGEGWRESGGRKSVVE
jgi:hypothetical protein